MLLFAYNSGIEKALPEIHYAKQKLIPVIAERFLVVIEDIFGTIRETYQSKKLNTCTISLVLTKTNAETLCVIITDLFNIHCSYVVKETQVSRGDSIYSLAWTETSKNTDLNFVWSSENRYLRNQEPIRNIIARRAFFPNPPTYPIEKHNEVFYQAAKEKDGTDVTFVVEGAKFTAHKVFLKRKAPDYFVPLLDKFKEARTDEIEIKEVKKEAFEEVLRFVYTGNIAETTDLSEILKIFEKADLFQIEGLKQLANTRLCNWLQANQLTYDNFGDVFRVGSIFGNEFALYACFIFTEKSEEALKIFLDLVTKDNYSVIAKFAQNRGFDKLITPLHQKSIELLSK